MSDEITISRDRETFIIVRGTLFIAGVPISDDKIPWDQLRRALITQSYRGGDEAWDDYEHPVTHQHTRDYQLADDWIKALLPYPPDRIPRCKGCGKYAMDPRCPGWPVGFRPVHPHHAPEGFCDGRTGHLGSSEDQSTIEDPNAAINEYRIQRDQTVRNLNDQVRTLEEYAVRLRSSLVDSQRIEILVLRETLAGLQGDDAALAKYQQESAELNAKRKEALDTEAHLPINMSSDRPTLERALAAALLDTISAHGPITAENRSSAAKRLIAMIKVWDRNGRRSVPGKQEHDARPSQEEVC
jgi:hypothetical protein